jgi:hypothetical protein
LGSFFDEYNEGTKQAINRVSIIVSAVFVCKLKDIFIYSDKKICFSEKASKPTHFSGF